MLKCLLDMDGVLVDFVKGAAKVHGFKPEDVDCWDFPAKFGIAKADFWGVLGSDFWAELEWSVDGKAILEAAERTFGKENVCLLSSPCDTIGCTDGKVRWIREHMPNYRRRFLLGPAKEFAASPNRWLIDDYEGNIESFTKAGGNAILVPRPWNALAGKPGIEHINNELWSMKS